LYKNFDDIQINVQCLSGNRRGEFFLWSSRNRTKNGLPARLGPEQGQQLALSLRGDVMQGPEQVRGEERIARTPQPIRG
jgi:hypothetical protein